jgi:UDP-galactopyranose mutase
VTEFKHLTGEQHQRTSIVYEYPRSEGDPYYPVPQPTNASIYSQYRKLAESLPNVRFVGRLGTYRYYNMDQVVGQALTLYKNLMRAEAAKLEVEPVALPAPVSGRELAQSV